MKRFIFLFCIVSVIQVSFAENTLKNYVFAKRDTCVLSMDVYTPVNVRPNTPCLVFVFGGGFLMGSKSTYYNVPYLKAMADRGFVVASIDYRLGMKNQKAKGNDRLKLLRNAINMAVEDLYSATNYLLNHSTELSINPNCIILSGSSAGAITVLQADYELANRSAIATDIPDNFHYAGVISFAGGILNYNGMPNYKYPPAPTMLFHGTEDDLVKYDKIKVLNVGFFGTNALVELFEKHDYPYYAYRYRDMGHEIAGVPMTDNIDDICSFIEDYVIQHKKLHKDILVKNPYLKRADYGKWKPKDLYK